MNMDVLDYDDEDVEELMAHSDEENADSFITFPQLERNETRTNALNAKLQRFGILHSPLGDTRKNYSKIQFSLKVCFFYIL